MRINMTDQRARLYDHLLEATGENTKSKSIDEAARFYCQMHGDNGVAPTGELDELMQQATTQGSLTPQEIAEILTPIEYEQEYVIE